MTWRVDVGDCVALMAAMPACSVDAVVCDPPYGLEFMGKKWDKLGNAGQVSHPGFADEKGFKGFRLASYTGAGNLKCRRCRKWTYDHPGRKCECPTPDVDRAHQPRLMQEWHHRWATQALRVLKPGGHLLAFGGTRTSHRLACAIEDAGFEIRDTICWLYGSGFPKSHNLSGEWDGWGTALKPAHEPIVVARKPLAGTVAANVLEYGTGGLNVDGCRVEGEPWKAHRATGLGSVKFFTEGDTPEIDKEPHALGRWPANVVLDEQAATMVDQQSGDLGKITGGRPGAKEAGRFGAFQGLDRPVIQYPDSGGASRFFYIAKASRAERNAGLDGFEEKTDVGVRYTTMAGDGRADPAVKPVSRANHHPTVKPVSLMRWLVRLVTPPDGLVLDPFTGSGTTGIAAVLEGFNFLGCEQDDAYADIARARIGWWELHGHDALRIVQEQEAAENERNEIRASGQMELL